MNNNRNNNNNNRRRGRGSRPQQGGGNQNRIDSRARGNAPQMLDKYKKLAQDAQHNGDRVQAEYYLQFADHYFRVIADNRVRPDEARSGGRPGERDLSADDDGSDEEDFDPMRQGRDERPREDRGRDDRPRDDRPREDRPRDDRPREDRPREDRPRDDRPRDDRNRGNDRQRARPRRDDARPRVNGSGPAPAGESANEYEPADNPFTGANRDSDPRPRRGRREAAGDADEIANDRGEIDAAALPPSFSLGVEGEADDAPRKPLARRRRKPAAESGATDGTAGGGGDDGGEPLTAVG